MKTDSFRSVLIPTLPPARITGALPSELPWAGVRRQSMDGLGQKGEQDQVLSQWDLIT